MHNLFPAAHRQRRRRPRQGRREIGDRRRRLRQHLRHRRREGHADLEAALRQHVPGADGRPRLLRAVPGRADGDAGHRADARRRASTRSTRSRGTAGCGSSTSPPARTLAPPEPFLPPNGKPYGLNLLQQRALHDDRAGLRRQPEPVLQLRPGDEEGRQLQSRAAAGCGRGSGPSIGKDGTRLRRQRRRRLLPRAADLRPGDHRGQAEPGDQGAGDDRTGSRRRTRSGCASATST